MQTTIEVNGKPVQITLTKDQVAQVVREASKDDVQIMYEEATVKLGRKLYTLEDFAFLPEEERQAFYSLYRLTTVIKAKKGGVKLDYTNGDQRKHYPWLQHTGSGFSLHGVRYGFTAAYVGARLSSESEKDAREVATVMQQDYSNWFIE